jgi:hypothetical protein
MTRIPINFPLGGLSDDDAFSSPKPGTTREAMNVRGVDPVTGRARGAQREGMSKYLTSTTVTGGSHPVADIAVVTRDSPKIIYANLDPPDSSAASDGWSRLTPDGDTALWLEVDFAENVYVLDGRGVVTKYNSSGVKLRSLSVPVPAGHELVHKLDVDADGGVIVGSYATNGRESRLWRFADSATSSLELDLAWEHEIADGALEMFGGNLYSVWYIVVNDAAATARDLWRLDSIITSTPTVALLGECPGPVHGIDLGDDGSVKLAVGPDATRGASEARDFFTATSDSADMWCPHDLANAVERLYFWVSADNVDGQGNATLSDGDEIKSWADNRFRDTTSGIGTYDPPLDTTNRLLFADTSGKRLGPTFTAAAHGARPAVRFRASEPTTTGTGPTGTALMTEKNDSASKASKTAKWPTSKAVIPSDHRFISLMVVRPNDSSSRRVLFAQNANGSHASTSTAQDFALLTGATISGGALDNELRGIQFYDVHTASNPITGGNADGATTQLLGSSNDNPQRCVLVTVVHNGGGAPTLYDALRVNGEVVDAFDFNKDRSYGDGSFSIFGSRMRSDASSSEDLFSFESAFGGEVLEVLTVLADSGAGVHDEPIMHSTLAAYGYTAGAPGTGGGSVRSWAAAIVGSALATEVELLEGYLAHKWGIADLLPNNGAATYYTEHPFGGTGNYPLKPDVRADSGALDLALSRRRAWDRHGKIVKYSAGGAQLSWAVSGAGLGYAVTAGDDRETTGIGPWVNLGGVVPGFDGLLETGVIARRIKDSGSQWRADAATRGLIYYASIRSDAAIPLDGDTITVSDGVTTKVFEFDSGGGVSGSNVAVTIAGSSTSLDNLVTAINAELPFLTAERVGYFAVEVRSWVANNSNEALLVSHPVRWKVYGMAFGRIEPDTWSYAGTQPDTPGVRLATDDNGDVWLPRFNGALDAATKLAKADGSMITAWSASSSSQGIYAVCLPLSHPAYIDQAASPTGPLFMYAGSSGGSLDPALDTLHKIRLVSDVQDLAGTTTARATRLLCVANSSLYEVTSSTTAVLKGSGSEFAAGSPYLQSAVLFNKVVWCDGSRYWVYDSVLDTFEEMLCKSAGSLPLHGKLLESWRGRLVIGRTEDDPHNVYMSRVGDPFDWDEFPADPDSLEAVSFGQSRVGLSPDIVNALIPYNDDLMVIGGDHTIQRLTGDPGFGGQLDLVSDVTGIAYGRAWCKDPDGRLFFFGSKGGVFVMVPGGIPERITRDSIERRLSDFDLGAYSIRLVWNYRAEGLHVFAVPLTSPSLGIAPALGAWFMDKNGAWWEDSFARTNESPASVAVLDGDLPGDRVLLLGGQDGYLRFWDEVAVNDDGQRIDSYVLLGPLAPASTTQQVKFLRPQVTLGAYQSGCDFEWFSSDTAELPGSPLASGKVGPGMNPTLPVRTRGSAVWLRLRSAAIAERWAFERASVDVVAGGRERVR